MAARIIKKLSGGTGENKVTVYGDPAKLSALCSGFTEDTAQSAANIQVSRAGGTVRQYPGDASTFQRGSSTAVVIKGGSAPSQTLPGKSFTVEVSTGTSPNKVTKVYTFTLVGTFTKLHALFVSGAKKALVLRSPGGRAYPIADPTP